MKWLVYTIIAITIVAHYYLAYLNLAQRSEKNHMDFTVEMSKIRPIFVHPIQEKE